MSEIDFETPGGWTDTNKASEYNDGSMSQLRTVYYRRSDGAVLGIVEGYSHSSKYTAILLPRNFYDDFQPISLDREDTEDGTIGEADTQDEIIQKAQDWMEDHNN